MSAEGFQVINTNDDRFETDVMVRSQLGLVVVDFWAEWCAPCRMLAPILEKLAEEFQDKFTLVKANTDHSPLAARQFSVAGIPAVYAILDEQVIDFFQGVLPEPALREWLEKCFQAVSIFEAKRCMAADPAKAESQLRELLESGGGGDQAKVALLQVLKEKGDLEACKQLLDELEKRGFLEPECEKIRSELGLLQHANDDLEKIRQQAQQNPDDLAVQFGLAESLAGAQHYEEAFEICLKLVERDRANLGEQARELMVNVFRVLGDDSELTQQYRRKLSMALY